MNSVGISCSSSTPFNLPAWLLVVILPLLYVSCPAAAYYERGGREYFPPGTVPLRRRLDPQDLGYEQK